MFNQRINLLPDPQFLALRPQLALRMEQAARAITPASFASFCDGAMRRVFTNFLRQCEATEGSIWLLDEAGENLVNVLNSGPDAAQLTGFRHPLKSGNLSMVFATHRPFMENQVFKHDGQEKSVDKLVGKRTHAMIAVPLYFAQDCRGVISAVQLEPSTGAANVTASAAQSFTPEDFAGMQLAAELLSRLIDFKLLTLMTGMGKA